MENVMLDPNCILIEETPPELLLPLDSPDLSDIFGDPQLSPRVGNKYQVEIPPMVKGTEHLSLLMDPFDSDGIPCLAHSFLLGLPLPVTWTHDEEDIDYEEEGKGGSCKPNDGTKVDESVKFLKCIKGQSSKRKRNSDPTLYVSDARLVNEKESNADNLECGMSNKTSLFRPFEVKNSHLVPGVVGDSWTNAEVDGFLLALYIFGKNFGQIKPFIENKDMGDILSFYYGAFYRSDGYYRWSDSQKRSRQKIVYGRKIFTGWRQQELLSRLLAHVPDELQNNLQEVSKSFLDGKTSLENYVCHLKTSVGLSALVEAVGIGKGKTDLTGLAIEPLKATQVSPEIPFGKACSFLTSSDIIRFLTGGFRLSKGRCNDIFWEAVWPRLLARGWHSEQPKNRCSAGSKHYLVFLMPGVKKFSRRKLVKGNHYFDSVSDVLSKVASEPTLIELDSEGDCMKSCNEENAGIPGESLDKDDPAYHKPCYLKPRVSIYNSNHMKFTVVDSSLIHGGKASKMRELRYSPIELMFTSKPINKNARDLELVNANHMLSKGDKCVTEAHQCEGIMASSTEHHMKFTVVDTSLLHGGKSSHVRELRCLPVKFEISSKIADRLSSRCSVATDAKPSGESIAADNVTKSEGKDEKDISNQDPRNSCTVDQNLATHQDKKTDTSEDARSKRIIKHHFSRRSKSSPSVSLTPEERKKLTSINKVASCLTENLAALSINLASPMKQKTLLACAKSEGSDLVENISSTPIDLISPMKRQRLNASTKTEERHVFEKSSAGINEQMGVCHALNSQEGNNDVLHASHFQEKVLFLNSSAEGNPESTETSQGHNEKLPFPSSISSDPPLFPLDDRKGGPGSTEADGSQFIVLNNYADLKTTTNDCVEEQQESVNPRRQSKRSRPLTTRVLEALESGFFNLKKTQKVRDVQAPAIQFSSPSRRVRSRKVSKLADVVVKTADAKEEKDQDGAFICSKVIRSQPPQVAD
ncbi:C2H2 and C2HC zinc fingers superfamily protein, putative isoform 1 [Hibiscus syriacus]|uniref:C2H2 and C2HC zinc fingers superfamily protein, putative isoform 1 n=1 Tax=Hibiscus syriacus TaxID=106335 RepID=A0A6A2Z0C5_HIBSY|nr:uncharacterized protein LOC120154002 [Hibiscus syriacus]KAE8685003.1 C2H2 and C2HC zinc fingers superfamily protein, putative isoform 1 [Hibiscus syriacus]